MSEVIGERQATKKPLEQERVPFIERMRDEHVPLTLKSISSLEKTASTATFRNQKIGEALESFKQARALTNEAQQSHLPSDFLSKYREAHKHLTEGGIAMAEGMEKNAEDIKFYK